MKFKFLTLFLSAVALAAFQWSCSDDPQPSVTDADIQENENYKLSSFTSEHVSWQIADGESELEILLHSHEDGQIYKFDFDVVRKASALRYTIYVPKTHVIKDGSYDVIARRKDGSSIGPRLVFTFVGEVVTSVSASRTDYFDLQGSGTEDDPFIISSGSDFQAFEYGLFVDSVSRGFGLYFRQNAEITAPPHSKTTTGRYHYGKNFAGTYDGGGNRIHVSYQGEKSQELDTYVGMFHTLTSGAVIRNLIVSAQITGVHSNGGGVCGMADGDVTLENVTVEGSITNSGDAIGGFIGSATIGDATDGMLTFKNCHLAAYIAGDNMVGGAIGSLYLGFLTVDGFSNTNTGAGTIQASYRVSATSKYAGGLVGSAVGVMLKLSNIRLVNSVSSTESDLRVVSAEEAGAGGLFGLLVNTMKGKIDGMNINAPVYAKNNAGGLIGAFQNDKELVFSNCEFSSCVKGEENVGGFFGMVHGSNEVTFEENNKIQQSNSSYLAVEGVKSVGGFAGFVDDIFITCNKKVFLEPLVKGTGSNIGGIVGYLFKTRLTVNNFDLDPNMIVSGPENVGGLVGCASSATIEGSIDIPDLETQTSIPSKDTYTSSFAGTVQPLTGGTGTSMGGLVGYAMDGLITGVCFSGTVAGTSNVGGIVGHLYAVQNGYVLDCVNRANKVANSTSDATGGIVGLFTNEGGTTLGDLINYSNIQGANRTGGIVGYITDKSTKGIFKLSGLANCGTITGSSNVGGIVGEYYASGSIDSKHLIEHAVNFGSVSNNSGGNVGGIIGYFNSRGAFVQYCANRGRVYGGSSGDIKVGGIAGRMGNNTYAAVVVPKNVALGFCCNFGEIGSESKSGNVGGILGWQEQGASESEDLTYMLHDCYNMGKLPTDQNADNGGILGSIDHYGEVRYCINVGRVDHGNGVVGTHKDGCIWYHHNLYYLEKSGDGWCADKFKEEDKGKESTFSGFDFNNNWVIDNGSTQKNSGYPYLKNCPMQFVTYSGK